MTTVQVGLQTLLSQETFQLFVGCKIVNEEESSFDLYTRRHYSFDFDHALKKDFLVPNLLTNEQKEQRQKCAKE
jgi:hypothetical protein